MQEMHRQHFPYLQGYLLLKFITEKQIRPGQRSAKQHMNQQNGFHVVQSVVLLPIQNMLM